VDVIVVFASIRLRVTQGRKCQWRNEIKDKIIKVKIREKKEKKVTTRRNKRGKTKIPSKHLQK
jgi:hypothetical protein